MRNLPLPLGSRRGYGIGLLLAACAALYLVHPPKAAALLNEMRTDAGKSNAVFETPELGITTPSLSVASPVANVRIPPVTVQADANLRVRIDSALIETPLLDVVTAPSAIEADTANDRLVPEMKVTPPSVKMKTERLAVEITPPKVETTSRLTSPLPAMRADPPAIHVEKPRVHVANVAPSEPTLIGEASPKHSGSDNSADKAGMEPLRDRPQDARPSREPSPSSSQKAKALPAVKENRSDGTLTPSAVGSSKPKHGGSRLEPSRRDDSTRMPIRPDLASLAGGMIGIAPASAEVSGAGGSSGTLWVPYLTNGDGVFPLSPDPDIDKLLESYMLGNDQWNRPPPEHPPMSTPSLALDGL